MTTRAPGFLDELLPIRRITVDGVATPFVRDVDFDSDTMAVTVNETAGTVSVGVKAEAVSRLVAWKDPVRAVWDAPLEVGGNGPFDGVEVDGVELDTGDRVAVIGATDPEDNGIYVFRVGVNDLDHSFSRAEDFDDAENMKPGTVFGVLEGDTYAGATVRLVSPTTGEIDPGVTELEFEVQLAPTHLATPESIVRRASGENPTEFNSLRTSDIRGWPSAPGVQSTDLNIQGGQPHVDDIGGLHTAGNFVFRLGFCDQGYESAQLGFVYGDPRLGLPESEYIPFEIGYYSPPDYEEYEIPDSDPPRSVSRTPNTFRIHTLANTVTGKPVNLDVASENGWLRIKANQHLSQEVGSKYPLIRVLQGPGGIVQELHFANRAQANGAVTVDLFGYDFGLDDRWVPYQRQGICTLEVSCYDAAFNVSESWLCRFLWRGGSVAGVVATSAFGKLAAPYGPAVIHAFTVGSARPENPTSTDGIIAIENGSGADTGKLRLTYTGLGGVNMNQIAATLRVVVPAV